MDKRITKLAKHLIEFSFELSSGDRLLIKSDVKARILVDEILRLSKKIDISIYVEWSIAEMSNEISNAMFSNEFFVSKFKAFEDKKKYETFDATLFIRSDIDLPISKSYQDNVSMHRIINKDNTDIFVNKKWALLNWPNESYAKKAKMSNAKFYDYLLDLMTLDYKKMEKNLTILSNYMNKTDIVQIISKDTNISFSIKNIGSVICCGRRNIPDGEVYSAPIKDSVNGTIKYNVKTSYNGYEFDEISFEFKNGRIIKSNCKPESNKKYLNRILDTDDGSRYIGEFALGTNNLVKRPINDILIDEKMGGSFHLTPGNCYKKANNGNVSGIHWDLIQKHDDKNKGEIYFDGKLVRKDGKFVINELKKLN